MSTQNIKFAASEIRAEACAWLAQLDSGELKPADLEAFREWLQRSPRHSKEIQQAAHLSADLNVLTMLQEPLQDALLDYRTVLEQPETGFRWPIWAMAATLTALAVFLGVLNIGTPKMEPMLITTAVGEYRKLDLDDGSSIEMNTNSKLRISYDAKQRVIQLMRGEALFSVAKDKNRPFIVYTQGRYVRAVGTAFVVRQDQSRFEVTVTEGEVQLGLSPVDISAQEAKIPPSAQLVTLSGPQDAGLAVVAQEQAFALKAGQRYIAPAGESSLATAIPAVTLVISERDLARELAWQDGLLEFSNTPLADVVREVSRYTNMSIEIADPDLRVLAFGGLFRTGDTPALFEALQSAYGIQVEYIDADSVTLSRPAQK